MASTLESELEDTNISIVKLREAVEWRVEEIKNLCDNIQEAAEQFPDSISNCDRLKISIRDLATVLATLEESYQKLCP